MKESRFAIKIPKLKLFGYHGCYEKEKDKGQEFELEMVITIIPQKTDAFLNTIDYVKVEAEIKKTFNDVRYDLLEDLSANISSIPYKLTDPASRLYKEIYSVSVTIRKNSPQGMSIPYVEVKYINYNSASRKNEEYQ
ncbi:MAG: hypothetical protein CMG11_00650 [Candidatus Marinimicrobia bacterium]|nr:hypothetical protein [Candidatus Neomarinimicrobiota bacterium]|tara:strand:+ start:1230 stop:1640 length:411 start_codon:yes stop_codon:yes gene_type:complete